MKLLKIFIIIFSYLLLSISIQYKFKIDAETNYDRELSCQEGNTLDKIVQEKLNINSYTYEFISGLNCENRYILVETKTSYLIFDREFLIYNEYSLSSHSPYYELNDSCKKIYIGPTYYYTIVNGYLIDLNYNTTLNDIQIKQLLEIEEAAYTNIFNYIFNHNNSSIKSTPPVENYQINHSYYFEKLLLNKGSNSPSFYSGSCGYVALNMLLSYYDTIINDNVINESYDVVETKSFSNYTSISTEAFTDSPGIDDRFHSEMISLGRSYNYTDSSSFSINFTNIINILTNYFNLNNINANIQSTETFTNKINFCKQAIYNNHPVLIRITGVDPSISYENMKHFVIGYKYESDGITANFGWKSGYTNVKINNYNITHALYINFNESHFCTNNYIWTLNGCEGTICPCGIKTCNHASTTYVNKNSNSHYINCSACYHSSQEDHDFYLHDELYICTKCEYSIPVDHIHNYTYTPNNDNRTHTVSCSCGDLFDQYCIGNTNGPIGTLCIKCKQIIGGPTEIPILSKKEDSPL